MTTSVRCPQCGAPFRAAEERFCSYCGTQRPEAPSAPSAGPDHAARFAAAQQHARLHELMRHAPGTAGRTAGGLFQLGFLVFFCVVAGAGLILFLAAARAFGPLEGVGGIGRLLFLLVPCLVLGGGIYALVTVARRLGRFHSSPLERRLARVLDERLAVSGGESPSTSYFTTLEWPDRTRQEFENEGHLAGKLARDDIGLAYTKGHVLLDFQRLEV